MHNGGKTVVLECKDYQAKIVTVGAGLAQLTYQGKHIIVPHHPEEIPLAHLGKVLIPWPNRIANGHYQFENREFSLPITEHATKASIHGFLAWRDWQIVEQSTSSVVLVAYLPSSYGYPFILKSTVTYTLDEHNGLVGDITTENIGTTVAPYGVGIHPYLTCHLELIDHYNLTIPAIEVFAIDECLNPMYLMSVNELGLDFLKAKQVDNTVIDHTFKADKPEWEVQIKSEHQRLLTYLRSDQPWIQIYTGDKLGRIGLAVEPMSCPPNAFNSKIGLIALQPGSEHTMKFVIGASAW